MTTDRSRRLMGGALGVATLALAVACSSSAGAAAPGPAATGGGAPATSVSPGAPTTHPVPARTVTPADSYAAARRVVQRHGFDPVGTAAGWHSHHRLNAIGGVLSASADGKYQRVFLFVDGRYIGLDASAPSGSLQAANTSDDVVTVTYGLFAPSDALCCPSSTRSVRFQWTGGKLVPLDPIPPVATGTTTGR
ncbi:MAG TPA: LppP/LprE family lipoprotein [Mycobacteriales bacterium]|jgi:hypothetical protein|nr:LppP/LprE family lipoprotein [Mycobacteriales bacterium]